MERRLVGIIAENWPDSGIISAVGKGSSDLTEDHLLEARKRGLNLAVEVAGRFYLPASRGLMMNGTGYDSRAGIVPLVITATTFEPGSKVDRAIESPHTMMVGLDPRDARPPWEAAAAHLGRLSVVRRDATAGATVEEQVVRLQHLARTLYSVTNTKGGRSPR